MYRDAHLCAQHRLPDGTALHRLLLLFEDEILVSQYGQWILVEGIRRGVARVIYRLDSYIRMKQYDKE